MTDTTERLTTPEIDAAGLPDWRPLLGRLKARFRTPDFASALALVAELDALTTDGRRPEVLVSDSGVVLALPGRGGSGIRATDLDAARGISAAAARLGLAADPAGLTQLEVGLDTSRAQAPALAPFYAALLGGEVVGGEPVDPSGQVPTVWWQTPGDGDGPDDGVALPEPAVPQRWHLDVWVAADEGERRLQAALDAGGRLVSDAEAPSFWVLEDADGNRSCICTPADR
jgi:4a-hydroxytetrahydrobiopterin dehydratase